MKIIRTVKEMQQFALQSKNEGKTIGFVPTMGYLHEGHQSLMQEARKQNDLVVLSIFVNPLQFGPNEDLDRYPRDEEHDKQVAKQEKVDVLFLPAVEEMYPESLSIKMSVTKRADVLCGRSREGHFEGVVTVLSKLFHIVLPTRAYFGLKDAQQAAIVQALIEDYNFPIELVLVPTVREEDGLAKSSRNVYLSDEERQEAVYISQALTFGRELVQQGEKNPKVIEEKVKQFIIEKTSGKIDYVELLAYPTLMPVEKIEKSVILATAVFFEKARLIDNTIFDQDGKLIFE